MKFLLDDYGTLMVISAFIEQFSAANAVTYACPLAVPVNHFDFTACRFGTSTTRTVPSDTPIPK